MAPFRMTIMEIRECVRSVKVDFKRKEKSEGKKLNTRKKLS